MSKFASKNNNRSDVPEHFDFSAGYANLVQTKNGNTLIEIIINADAIYALLEEHGKEASQNCGYVGGEGHLFFKLKGIPLNEPRRHKSHFLKPDYYKKD